MGYAPAEHWDQYFDKLHQTGGDLDWGERWIGAVIKPLRRADCRTVLDLGCGTGNEVLRLTRADFVMTGLDYSQVGIRRAMTKVGTEAHFVLADMARPLPFPALSFDAVMSNVAAHMFSDRITRAIFVEIRRILRPQGLFLFHLNALQDRPFRAQYRPEIRQLEENYILEQDGRTMHFFSEEYLLELLSDWRDVNLELVEIPGDCERGYPPKRVWSGIAWC